VAIALGGAAVVLASCGADYQYVNNSQERAFFRLPNDVEVFRVRTEEPTDRLIPIDLSTTDPWNVVFDAAEDPTPDHLAQDAPTSIVGQASIIPVGLDVAENLSVKQVRTVLAGGTDPIEAFESGEAGIEVVTFESLSENGLTGSRVVFNREVADGVWTTYDQTSFIDVANRKVYLFEVKCEASCFKDQRKEISQIVDSWQVRE
jgi:hypothetical protein